MRKKQIRTSVLIDDDAAPLDDWDFIKRNGLKPTNLLRLKIKELRRQKEGQPTTKDLLRMLNEAREKRGQEIELRGALLKILSDKFGKDEVFEALKQSRRQTE